MRPDGTSVVLTAEEAAAVAAEAAEIAHAGAAVKVLSADSDDIADGDSDRDVAERGMGASSGNRAQQSATSRASFYANPRASFTAGGSDVFRSTIAGRQVNSDDEDVAKPAPVAVATIASGLDGGNDNSGASSRDETWRDSSSMVPGNFVPNSSSSSSSSSGSGLASFKGKRSPYVTARGRLLLGDEYNPEFDAVAAKYHEFLQHDAGGCGSISARNTFAATLDADEDEGEERVVYSALIAKKNPVGIPYYRQLILTNTPRMLYIEPTTMTVKGEVVWKPEAPPVVEEVNRTTFSVSLKGDKTLKFIDATNGAAVWVTHIRRVLEQQAKHIRFMEQAPK